MIEDELLKWRFKRGSREALTRIYEKYVHLLLSVAMGLPNDPHEAEDVVQDVFVSFARGAHRFRSSGQPQGVSRHVRGQSCERSRSQRACPAPSHG
jgi:DNA-directed RNA polymerase specialized sigma24 family protein